MGSNTYSTFISGNENPTAAIGAVTTDLNVNPTTENLYRQAVADRLAYYENRLAELIGVPILISGINASTNLITTSAAHGLVANDPVRIVALGTGTLPGGTDGGVVYYWLADSATTGKISATEGGSAVDITNAGTGPIYVYKVVDALGTLLASGDYGDGNFSNLVLFKAGTQSVSGAKTFDDITVSGTNKYKLTSRGVERTHDGLWYEDTTERTTPAPISFSVDSECMASFRLPNGCTLSSVTFYVDPADHTGTGLPATMPSFKLWKNAVATGTQTQIGTTATDTSANATIYSAVHAIAKSGLSEVIDNANYSYFMQFFCEAGANAAAIFLLGVKFSITVTQQDDAAC